MEKIKRVLVVVDVQKGFITHGDLSSHLMMSVVPEILRLIKEEFVNEDDEIVFLLDTHTKESVEFKRFGGGSHCLEDTIENEFVDELLPFTKDKKIFKKNNTMVYALEEYRNYLDNNLALEEMVFVGLLRDMCVFDAAYPTKKHFEQFNRDVKVIVPDLGTDTYTFPAHDKEDFNLYTTKMLNQVGVETPKVYKKEIRR